MNKFSNKLKTNWYKDFGTHSFVSFVFPLKLFIIFICIPLSFVWIELYKIYKNSNYCNEFTIYYSMFSIELNFFIDWYIFVCHLHWISESYIVWSLIWVNFSRIATHLWSKISNYSKEIQIKFIANAVLDFWPYIQ